jgi:arsenate reductase
LHAGGQGRDRVLRGSGMTVAIYHNPACGTSRNVPALLRGRGLEPLVIRYLKTPPSREELVSLIGRMGISTPALLRRQGTPYDQLNLDDPERTEDELIDAMIGHPTLINRPIVVTPRGVKLCRPVATAIALFGFQSGAALATVVGVLVEVPVMLSVVHIVRRSRGWYEAGN